jgi:hypothetical protein
MPKQSMKDQLLDMFEQLNKEDDRHKALHYFEALLAGQETAVNDCAEAPKHVDK